MGKFRLEQEAIDDIRQIMLTSKKHAASILALLDEIRQSPILVGALLDGHKDTRRGDGSVFNVTQFRDVYRRGYDIWRIKFWDTSQRLCPYRILYAYDIHSHDFFVLAVMHRSVEYERDQDFVSRLKKTYHRLGLTVERLH
jgi:hypothetical protein